jgi:hypothetical protein
MSGSAQMAPAMENLEEDCHAKENDFNKLDGVFAPSTLFRARVVRPEEREGVIVSAPQTRLAGEICASA